MPRAKGAAPVARILAANFAPKGPYELDGRQVYDQASKADGDVIVIAPSLNFFPVKTWLGEGQNKFTQTVLNIRLAEPAPALFQLPAGALTVRGPDFLGKLPGMGPGNPG
jgi:hypothetical protein